MALWSVEVAASSLGPECFLFRILRGGRKIRKDFRRSLGRTDARIGSVGRPLDAGLWRRRLDRLLADPAGRGWLTHAQLLPHTSAQHGPKALEFFLADRSCLVQRTIVSQLCIGR